MPQPWTIRREVDLARDFVGVERIAALATTSAKAAHELRIAVKSSGKTVDMDGASVVLNLILPDGVSTTADGSIEAGACIVTLPPLCYQRGETRGVLLMQFGTQAAIPVYAFVLRCFEDLTDAFADPDHVIPSLAEILAQLDAAKAAAKAAQDGASAANSAADAARTAAGSATVAASDANTAAVAASKAAQAADAAAARLDGLTATATGLAEGSDPTVSVTTGEDGARVLAFGIPKGDKGDTGETGPQGPKGDTGDIGALTINGKKPDGSGAVTLTAEDLGAASAKEVSQLNDDLTAEQTARVEGLAEKLGKDETAADSAKLGGKTLAEIMLDIYPVGAVYISVNSTSPASLFGGTWEQLQDRFLLAAGSTYSAGSTGGEETHKLTVAETASHIHDGLVWASSIPISGNAGTGAHNLSLNWNTGSSSNQGYSTTSAGGDQPHNNMPPYLAVYMWKRVS